jgi:hypothetical protein
MIVALRTHPRTSAMSSPAPPRLQFSLRWLFFAITGLAVFLGLSVLLGSTFAEIVWLFVSVVLPGPLVIAAIFGRGTIQAFAIGALVPWIVWSFGKFPLNSWGFSFAMSIYLFLACAISGGLAVATRRWLDRRHDQ